MLVIGLEGQVLVSITVLIYHLVLFYCMLVHNGRLKLQDPRQEAIMSHGVPMIIFHPLSGHILLPLIQFLITCGIWYYTVFEKTPTLSFW